MMTRDIVVAIVAALLALAAVVFAAQRTAFRNGEEAQLGRFPHVALILALFVALAATWSRNAFAPSPVVLGVVAGALAGAAWADLRVWEIPDLAAVLIFGIAIVDAIKRGELAELAVGLLAVTILVVVASRGRILKGGDVKMALALGAAFGGLFGVIAVVGGFIGFAAVHFYRQARSRVPLTTRLPWTPFLAFGAAAAFLLTLSPIASLFVVALP